MTITPIKGALLSGLALLASVAATGAMRESPADSEVSTGYVEEMVVTAERLEKGEWPTGTIITQTYNVRQRGMLLYELGRYAEALPLLLVAAERGFKWPQAMAGDIYLHGRGGVRRDLRSGFGWLGVAASPRTSPQIDGYFRQAMAELPDHDAHSRGSHRGRVPRPVGQPRMARLVPSGGIRVAELRGDKFAAEQTSELHLLGRDTCLSPAFPRPDVRTADRRRAVRVGMRPCGQGTRGCLEGRGPRRITRPG